jgi:hypothetical protein
VEAHAGSQRDLTQDEQRAVKITAISCEIIFHYLREGLTADQVDDKLGDITLTYTQKLSVYQAMCKESGETPHETVLVCTTELNGAPYVNIYDFVDTFRKGLPLEVWEDFEEFCCYTKARKRYDLKAARQSDFLTPLLQDLEGGPRQNLRPQIRDSYRRPSGAHRSNAPDRSLCPLSNRPVLHANKVAKAEAVSTALPTPQTSSQVSVSSSPVSPTNECLYSSPTTTPNSVTSSPPSSPDTAPAVKLEAVSPSLKLLATNAPDEFDDGED